MMTLDSDTVRALMTRLQALGPDSPAQWGRMSARQMVCHLNDSFSLAMGLKAAAEDVTFVNRTLVRWAALRLPFRWPRGVPTRPEMDQLVGGTPPADFARDTTTLARHIRRFAGRPRDFEFARHPIFGELTEWEWMRWGYLHADHHFRQFGV